MDESEKNNPPAYDKVEHTLAELQHADWRVRDHVAWTFGHLRQVDAVEPLIRLLYDDHSKVRETAITALGLIGDSRAIAPLLALTKDHLSPNRLSVIRTLSWFADPVLLPLLIEWSGDSNVDVCTSALYGLSRLGTLSNIAPLLEALRSDVSSIRHTAVCSLGRLHDPRAVDDLCALLQREPKGYIRGAAARSLGYIGDPRSCDALIAALAVNNRAVRLSIARALGQLNPAAEDVLLNLLASDDNKSRYLAAWTLGRMGTTRSIPLLETIQQRDTGFVAWYGQKKQPTVQRVAAAAASAIGRIRSRAETNP